MAGGGPGVSMSGGETPTEPLCGDGRGCTAWLTAVDAPYLTAAALPVEQQQQQVAQSAGPRSPR